MSKSTKLHELRDRLQADAKSANPRYPFQGLLALRSEAVRAAMDARFEQGESLVGITPLPSDANTGLIPIRFDFETASPLRLGEKSILVLVDELGAVVGVKDGFCARPDPPAVVEFDDQPFVLSEPTVTETRPLDPEAVKLLQDRERSFLKKRGLLRRGRDDDEPERVDTTCFMLEQTSSTSIRIMWIDTGFGRQPVPVNVVDDANTFVTEVVDDSVQEPDIGDIFGEFF